MGVMIESMTEAFPELPSMPKGDLQHPDECVREKVRDAAGALPPSR